MKKLMAWLLAAMLMVGCAKNVQTQPYVRALTAEEKAEDLEHLYQTLCKKHKNLFFQTSKDVYESRYRALMAQIPQLSDEAFYYELLSFVALAGDAHTMLGIDKQRVSAPAFLGLLPFEVAKFEGVWRLTGAEKAHSALLGLEVLAVGDMPVDELYSSASTLISHETEAWLDMRFPAVIRYMDALSYLGAAKDENRVTLWLRDGDARVPLELLMLDEAEAEAFEPVRMDVQTPVTGRDDAIYHFRALEGQTLFIQYNECREDPDLSMKAFAAQVEDALRGGAYEKVVLDLRYNSGGNSAMIRLLKQVLAKALKEQAFAFYTLIGPQTFSSGILNAAELKDSGAVLVGMPTGGSVNGYGELGAGELVHMPVKFYYSTKYFLVDPSYEGGSLLPDIELDQSFSGYLDGEDDVVSAIVHDRLPG